MMMRTLTVTETMERFLPDTAEITWKCNTIASGFCVEIIFHEMTSVVIVEQQRIKHCETK